MISLLKRYVNGPASPLLLLRAMSFILLMQNYRTKRGEVDPKIHNDCEAVPVPVKSNPTFRLTLGEERERFM